MGEAPQVAQFARQRKSSIRVIAVAAPFSGAKSAEGAFRGYVTSNFISRFGNAPINVYVDPKGTFWNRYYNTAPVVGSGWDRHAFFSASGTPLRSIPGYPFL